MAVYVYGIASKIYLCIFRAFNQKFGHSVVNLGNIFTKKVSGFLKRGGPGPLDPPLVCSVSHKIAEVQRTLIAVAIQNYYLCGIVIETSTRNSTTLWLTAHTQKEKRPWMALINPKLVTK